MLHSLPGALNFMHFGALALIEYAYSAIEFIVF